MGEDKLEAPYGLIAASVDSTGDSPTTTVSEHSVEGGLLKLHSYTVTERT